MSENNLIAEIIGIPTAEISTYTCSLPPLKKNTKILIHGSIRRSENLTNVVQSGSYLEYEIN